MMKANVAMGQVGQLTTSPMEPCREQREVPRTLENMAELISEIDRRLEYLVTEITPVLTPSPVSETNQPNPASQLGSPLAMTLDVLNNRLFRIQQNLFELTSRVQL